MCNRFECSGLPTRPVDAHAQDRQVAEPPSHTPGKPQTRFRRRLEQENVGLLTLDPLAWADRPVAEPQEVIVPARALLELSRIIGDTEGNVEVTVTPSGG